MAFALYNFVLVLYFVVRDLKKREEIWEQSGTRKKTMPGTRKFRNSKHRLVSYSSATALKRSKRIRGRMISRINSLGEDLLGELPPVIDLEESGQHKGYRCRIMFGESIGLREKSSQELMLQVEDGLPYSMVINLQENLKFSIKQMAEVITVKERTLTRRKQEGILHSDESDRLIRVTRIYELAVNLFEGDGDEAVNWLTSPKSGLGGKVPLDIAKTEIGAREVEKLIGRLEYGVF